jgi:hypothetical protein
MLLKRLDRIEQALTEGEKNEHLLEAFDVTEIRTLRRELEEVYGSYLAQVQRLKKTVDTYHLLHGNIAEKLRASFRLLNKILRDFAPERFILGLPAEQPTKKVKSE